MFEFKQAVIGCVLSISLVLLAFLFYRVGYLEGWREGSADMIQQYNDPPNPPFPQAEPSRGDLDIRIIPYGPSRGLHNHAMPGYPPIYSDPSIGPGAV